VVFTFLLRLAGIGPTKGECVMTEYGNSLSKLAEVLDRAKREMDLALEQCTTARHLSVRGVTFSPFPDPRGM
jgi:hypothetical protein